MFYLLEKEGLRSFLDSVFKRNGMPYIWPCADNNYSGKDLKHATVKNAYDCSGLVTASLYESSGGKIDHRATWNAGKLMRKCALVVDPAPGDLCFYGPSSSLITHVMVYIGNCERPAGVPKDWKVIGASGGDSRTTTLEKAKEMDANVRGFKSHLYRSDFIGFGRLVK